MQHEGRKPRVHFSGIGGTGMVAGARLAIEAGWDVRGSDTPLYPPTSEMVAALRAPVTYAYNAANLDWDPDVVVIGNALSRGNPEVEYALERRMRMMSLPEWLKEYVLRQRRAIVIGGTHGKTTTTALTAFVLEKCGFGPGFFIGGQPLDFEHSARLGAPGAPFVIEGDEYDSAFFDKRAKFLHYLPDIAVATSIEFDHGDIYANLAEIETAFQRMLRQVPQSGWVVACADNHAASLLPHAFSRTATYGFTPGATWRGEMAPAARGGPRMRVYREDTIWAVIEPSLKGKHNRQNVLAAVAVAGILGAAPEAVADAVRVFQGVRRRMEVFLEAEGITYIDDFAHHPTAIRETIAAARDHWPDRRIRVLFEPRSNTTVTKRFQQDMTDAFVGADEVWLGPIYRAERIPEEERLDRAALAASLCKRGVPCHASNSVAEIVAEVRGTEQPGDIVLVLSNGAFGGIYRQFHESHAASV